MFLWRQVPPLMTFCGQWETTWQRLTQIGGQLHTFKTAKYEMRVPVCVFGHASVHVWMVYCVRIDFDPEDIAVLN